MKTTLHTLRSLCELVQVTTHFHLLLANHNKITELGIHQNTQTIFSTLSHYGNTPKYINHFVALNKPNTAKKILGASCTLAMSNNGKHLEKTPLLVPFLHVTTSEFAFFACFLLKKSKLKA